MSIKIFSYNVSWESMTGKKSSWRFCNTTNRHSNRNNHVCIQNVAHIIDENCKTCDFITLQEAANYKDIIDNSKILKKMDYLVHKSGPEYMITFWDKEYTLDKYYHGEFESGRPYQILMFSNMCIVNIHMGHYDLKKLKSQLNKIVKGINKKYKYRIIISGDFNYDITGHSIVLDNIKFKINKRKFNTCCNPYNTRQFDHIIDSKHTPIIKPIYTELMASDHVPISAKIKI